MDLHGQKAVSTWTMEDYKPFARVSTKKTPIVYTLHKSVQLKKKKRQRNEQPPVTYKDIHQHHNIRVSGRYKSLILSQTSTLKLQPSTATEIVFNFSCFAFVCTYIRTYTYVYICMQQPVSVTQPMKFYRQLLLINLEDTFSFSRTNS